VYDFRSLSATDFEHFTADLLSAELAPHLGEPLASYAPGRDGGIDLRAVHPATGTVTIVQCKHRPELKGAALRKTLEREAAARVVQAAAEVENTEPAATAASSSEASNADTPELSLKVDRYLLATSAEISPDAEEQAITALAPLPVPAGGIWARGKLNTTLSKHPPVERKHFKLWLDSTEALERIIGSSVAERSSWLVDKIISRLPLYAPTPAYTAAHSILEHNHVVVITGDPGSGKSTTAHLLLLTCAASGWEIVDVSSDVNEAWAKLPGDRKVFFYDDFLGQADAAEVNKNEAARIQDFMARIRTGQGRHRLVLTTRDQVLAQAQTSSDDRLRRLNVDRERSRIRLPQLSRLEKAHILHNHLHFALHDDEQRALAAVDTRWQQVIDHPNFNPRLIESAQLQCGGVLEDLYQRLLEALDHPQEVWAGSWQSLPAAATRVLLHLATSPRPRVPVTTLQGWSDLDDAREWKTTLQILSSGWIDISRDGQQTVAALTDPSRRDFVLGLLVDSAYLDQAARSAPTLQHLQFVLKLAGRSPSGAASGAGGGAALVELLGNAQQELLQRAALLFELATTEVHAQPAYYLGLREQLCARYADVLADLQAQLDISHPLLQAAAQLLEQHHVSAQPVFALAAALERCNRPPRDSAINDVVVRLVDKGVQHLDGADGLSAFEALGDLGPDDARFAGQMDPIVRQVIEYEIEGLTQQDDLALVNGWFNDIDSLATRYDVTYDSTDITSHINSLLERDSADVAEVALIAAASPAEPVGPEHGDEEIAALFATLR